MGMLETVTQKIKEIVWWHEDMVEDFAEKYNLSIYQASWISFIKGVIVVLFLQWLF
jgi:hypothetical protein